ncbi:MAG: propionate--CoA ligase [Magnetococcales bacterium]|nr:propionate--CoA ligase [Magnetococcales bacterium]
MGNRQKYEEFYRESIDNKEDFWRKQAELVEWDTPFNEVLDYSNPPFAKWFPDGKINLCHNAVDRHLTERGDQNALIWVSTEENKSVEITYQDLHDQVNQAAAVYQSLGVGKGDRVLIYMPMIPQAVVAMLACVRIGAVHSVVFGGFAAHALASRIDDATPKVIVSADAGLRNGKPIPYKPLLDASFEQITTPKPKVLMVNRGLAQGFTLGEEEYDWDGEMGKNIGKRVAAVSVESTHPSYILYTSGTTGTPKGVQRDTGGHAVAMRASMKHIYDLQPGETMLTGSDIGWVVGHSYIVYAPLLTGATTILYEGLPIRPDPGIWWSIIEKYKVSVMFTAPTAIRLLKKTGEEWIEKYDLSSLRYLFLAGEPLDRETHRWISGTLTGSVVDNYWQTETGWPILTNFAGLGLMETKFGSPALPAYGYDVQLVDEQTAQPVKANEKGSLMIKPPLPPGCMTTIWGDDKRFVETYFSRFKELMYASFDYAMHDDDGYYFIMGRDDDVINVAGHRLGTREIEEILCTHPSVVEVAAVGIKDELKGQEVVAFVVTNQDMGPAGEADLKALVSREIGPIARPKHIYMVNGLPKTRSGKVLRRAILSLAEGDDPGDLPTIDDASVLDGIKSSLKKP